MKKTLIILVLIFTFFGCERGPLIEDFKIEGIGLGDSLLKHFSADQIKSEIEDLRTFLITKSDFERFLKSKPDSDYKSYLSDIISEITNFFSFNK